jgi:hypothetical protein
MDIKFIILLAILLGLVLLFLKEIAVVKTSIEERYADILTNLNDSNKKLGIKFCNVTSAMETKLRVTNSDYLAQFRKMEKYGSQPITNVSNHFTETEQDKYEDEIVDLSAEPKNDKFEINDLQQNKCIDKNKKLETESEDNSDSEEQTIDNNINNTPSPSDGASIDIEAFSKESNQTENNIEKEIIKNENNSIMTDITVDLTLTNFKPSDSYKKSQLDKFAKSFSIPLTHKDGKTWKPYNKNELYTKIKDHLIKSQ